MFEQSHGCGVAAARQSSKLTAAVRSRLPVLASGVVVARLALNQSGAVRFGGSLLASVRRVLQRSVKVRTTRFERVRARSIRAAAARLTV